MTSELTDTDRALAKQLLNGDCAINDANADVKKLLRKIAGITERPTVAGRLSDMIREAINVAIIDRRGQPHSTTSSDRGVMFAALDEAERGYMRPTGPLAIPRGVGGLHDSFKYANAPDCLIFVGRRTKGLFSEGKLMFRHSGGTFMHVEVETIGRRVANGEFVSKICNEHPTIGVAHAMFAAGYAYGLDNAGIEQQIGDEKPSLGDKPGHQRAAPETE